MTQPGMKVTDEAISSVLMDYCEDLTAQTAQNGRPIFPGAGEDIREVLAGVSAKRSRSICFTGLAGTGKSTMISAVAQYLAAGHDVPESLKGARVIMLDIDAMKAGANFVGQFEMRLRPLLEGLKEREGILDGRKILLASDKLPSLLGNASGSSFNDASAMIKPFLMSKGITLLAAATPEEYHSLVAGDPALARRFDAFEMLPPGERAKRRAEAHAAKMSSIMEAFTKGSEQPVAVMQPLVIRGRSFAQMGKGLFA